MYADLCRGCAFGYPLLNDSQVSNRSLWSRDVGLVVSVLMLVDILIGHFLKNTAPVTVPCYEVNYYRDFGDSCWSVRLRLSKYQRSTPSYFG